MEIRSEIKEMDSFDLDKELSFALEMTNEDDSNALQWLAELAYDKACRIKGSNENTKCQRCKDEGKELHSCPYKEEINGDYNSKCNCCESCRQECLYDI